MLFVVSLMDTVTLPENHVSIVRSSMKTRTIFIFVINDTVILSQKYILEIVKSLRKSDLRERKSRGRYHDRR